MQQHTEQDRRDAQIAMYMRRNPAAFARLLNDPEQDTGNLAERVLRGLNRLRRIENEPKPSEPTTDR